MAVVLVHGNPESDSIWNPLAQALNRDDIVRLSPPGFGAPLPQGFSATYLAYRDWLESELEALSVSGEPIDLVGHDWGGVHVVNAMMHRPELVRSWATDIIGVFDPDYVWPETAQIWRTPGAGERLVENMLGGTVDERTALWSATLPPDIARSLAQAQGPEMGRATLLLYRSVEGPGAMAQAGGGLERAQARPGLSLLATDDPYVGSESIRRRCAQQAGARTAELEGLGHWWMTQDPVRGAAALTSFWRSVAAAG
ncbi:alpha/beta hydrolase [Mycolicibacter minnesotensis]|uniref:Alpha/beta hydrolase n=1 Tax=Mycolicibacter minnesotensis TaxID=1118379 RepID=A0A7I7R214_9MYCO|nr:alpha/beta hydrolase [Mycolicibacter minnesotensis]ORB02646.1 alpha/beta hydrolase [Mycolicibacter minnesotensis]BBY32671.1 hydrolase [Mycolicibacter minnesotensis]